MTETLFSIEVSNGFVKSSVDELMGLMERNLPSTSKDCSRCVLHPNYILQFALNSAIFSLPDQDNAHTLKLHTQGPRHSEAVLADAISLSPSASSSVGSRLLQASKPAPSSLR